LNLDVDPLHILLQIVAHHTGVFRSNRQSRVTHPCVDVELWLRSRVTAVLSNLPLVTARPKPPEKRKKAKISVGFVESAGPVRAAPAGNGYAA
jgi:hypothetical protein